SPDVQPDAVPGVPDRAQAVLQADERGGAQESGEAGKNRFVSANTNVATPSWKRRCRHVVAYLSYEQFNPAACPGSPRRRLVPVILLKGVGQRSSLSPRCPGSTPASRARTSDSR